MEQHVRHRYEPGSSAVVSHGGRIFWADIPGFRVRNVTSVLENTSTSMSVSSVRFALLG